MKRSLHVVVLLTLASASACAQANSHGNRYCKVTRVTDGDSMECEQRGQVVRVRMLGIDAPELAQKPYGTQARAFLERLMPVGTSIVLDTDVRERDQYGRVLAYVWNDSATMINEELLRAGFAVPYILPPNVKYAEDLRAASASARKARVGLWASSGFECAPSDFRKKSCR